MNTSLRPTLLRITTTKINAWTLDNVEKTTSNLAASKIPETVASPAVPGSITELNGIMGKLNSRSNGSMGLLLNDKKLTIRTWKGLQPAALEYPAG